MRRLVDAIKAWISRTFGKGQPRHDTKRELDEFFG